MIYLISFLAAAAVPLAIAGYGGHLAAKVLDRPQRRRALAVIWALGSLGVLLAGFQQVLMSRSDAEHERQQAAMQARAEQEQQQLRDKLDVSLHHEEEVRTQLGSIVQYLQKPQSRMNTRELASATSKMVEDAMHR
jgi:hypothetical protein